MSEVVGYIDKIVGNKIFGWAWSPAKPEAAVDVEYVRDGQSRARAAARLFREDLAAAGIGAGNHGFELVLPESETLPREMSRIFVRVSGTNARLALSAYCQDTSPHLSDGVPAIRGTLGARGLKNALGRLVKRRPPGHVTGKVESLEGDTIQGWLFTPGDKICTPVIFVDDDPATLLKWPELRPDVDKALGASGGKGFRFGVRGLRAGARIRLYALSDSRLKLIDEFVAPVGRLERSPLKQLVRAAEIAAQPKAVAVTCWDGGHNPAGRAKVLYDVLQTERPAILFTYLFRELGTGIWPPLLETGCEIVTIPWEQRRLYHRMIQSMGIAFDTVWICKPRLPSFMLASVVAAPDARLILDFDDNEEHFSRSNASRNRAYGLTTLGLSRLGIDRVRARTAASITLKEEFDAVFVRHVRRPLANARLPNKAGKGPFNIGFIGTVRPHKRMLEAAGAVQDFKKRSGLDVTLHVHGDISPAPLRQDLAAAGAKVGGSVAQNALGTQLAKMDVVLTGYPQAEGDDDPITRYQISSKIGDAFSVGRPVLVPEGPSVADLEGTRGLFLFNEHNFEERLRAALSCKESVSLPQDYTLPGGYAGFRQAEKKAGREPRAREVLSPLFPGLAPVGTDQPVPTLLLVWKQHDSALYGRRIDQIARAYRRAFPGHRVVVLELLHFTSDNDYKKGLGNFLSDHGLICELNARKQSGKLVDADGVEYHQIVISSSDRLEDLTLEFLAGHDILPGNSVVVLFPFIHFLDRIYDLLAPYPTVVDVVDNQLSWASGDLEVRINTQYNILARAADVLVFNSARNLEFFQTSGILPGTQTPAHVLPNWYMLPAGFEPIEAGDKEKDHFDIVYSGNLNDRIDWQLIGDIAALDDRVRVNLVGSGARAKEAFYETIDQPNVVYYGPMAERDMLRFLSRADLAIMPHTVDKVSSFMNPLKLHMYRALGLHTISTDVPGIEADELVTICADQERFVKAVTVRMKDNGREAGQPAAAKEAADYVQLITGLR